MSNIDDGGQAFPSEGEGHGTPQYHSPGMTLRDWFAGQAMAGIMAQSHQGPKDWTKAGHGWGEDALNSLNKREAYYPHTLARFAYAIADAMLAARVVAEKQEHAA